MATVNVYERFYTANGVFNGVERRGALVMLIADSCAGTVRYEAAVTFFPHTDETDYAVSYDAYFSVPLYEGPGRRSKKRAALFLKELRARIDELAAAQNAAVLWDRPLTEPRTC